MAAILTPSRLIAVAGLALGLAACNKLGSGQDAMSWARAALERNDRIEVVAADQQTGTFTVRLKDTGELRTLRIDQIVGGPPLPTGREAKAGAQAAAAPAPTSAEPAPPPAQTATPSADAQSSPTDTHANTVAASGEPAAPPPQPSAAEPAQRGDQAAPMPGGRVLRSGPGYTISAPSRATAVAARTEREPSTTSAAVERRHDPIICQGARLLHIDNRNLEFDGDAVTAEDGCEIHITNSHISAKGVGVTARGAHVHIENSQIEGDSASIDASDGAQVYAASSQFKGMNRTFDNSSFHDLGGNVWN